MWTWLQLKPLLERAELGGRQGWSWCGGHYLTRGLAGLELVWSGLLPAELEEGRWPADDEWGLSDHGVVTCVFRAQ